LFTESPFFIIEGAGSFPLELERSFLSAIPGDFSFD
jgi:hypothetical protein